MPIFLEKKLPSSTLIVPFSAFTLTEHIRGPMRDSLPLFLRSLLNIYPSCTAFSAAVTRFEVWSNSLIRW